MRVGVYVGIGREVIVVVTLGFARVAVTEVVRVILGVSGVITSSLVGMRAEVDLFKPAHPYKERAYNIITIVFRNSTNLFIKSSPGI